MRGVIASLVAAGLVTAQAPAPIRVSVHEVIVPITVVDDKGRFVSDLEQSDFRIFEDGREQKIVHFSRERNQPVVVGFLLEMSNSIRMHWKFYQDAAMELINVLLPGDKKYSGYLITYGNEAELAANTSHDPEKMLEKIRKMKPGGGASLFDAVHMALTRRELVKGEPIEPRRVIVIIGNGDDTASGKRLEEVLELAVRHQATIYGISTTGFGFSSAGDKNLARLAEETGGRVVYPQQGIYKDVSGYLSTPSDEGNYALKVGTGGYASAIAQAMFRAISDIHGEISTQYIIRYIPDQDDTSRVRREIRVQVNLPPLVKIRHKQYYYPLSP
ncbi:MAG: VWA domain-containing protein [Bryobacteraceae bacterium]